MATRLLLTLLALLASLAAQLTPAQARMRVGGESEIGLSVAVVRSDRLAAVPTSVAPRSLAGERGRGECTVLMLRPRGECTLTVQLRSDRSRE